MTINAANVSNGPHTVSAARLHPAPGALILAKRRDRATSTNCVAPLCVILGPIRATVPAGVNTDHPRLGAVERGKTGTRRRCRLGGGASVRRLTPPRTSQLARRATMGSTAEALRAGARQATAAMRMRINAMPANVIGSVASTWKRSPLISLVKRTAAAIPKARPTATRLSPSLSTMPRTSARPAPRAMRTPISWVRWLTEKATTPPRPAAVMQSARSANIRSSVVVSRGDARASPRTSSSVCTLASGCPGSIASTSSPMRRAIAPGSAEVRMRKVPSRKGSWENGRYTSSEGSLSRP